MKLKGNFIWGSTVADCMEATVTRNGGSFGCLFSYVSRVAVGWLPEFNGQKNRGKCDYFWPKIHYLGVKTKKEWAALIESDGAERLSPGFG